MKVITALSLYAILHIIVFVVLVLASIGIVYPEFLVPALIILGLLFIIDILLAIYYLAKKPCKKEGSGYHKLKIEEADKYSTETDKKKIKYHNKKNV